MAIPALTIFGSHLNRVHKNVPETDPTKAHMRRLKDVFPPESAYFSSSETSATTPFSSRKQSYSTSLSSPTGGTSSDMVGVLSVGANVDTPLVDSPPDYLGDLSAADEHSIEYQDFNIEEFLRDFGEDWLRLGNENLNSQIQVATLQSSSIANIFHMWDPLSRLQEPWFFWFCSCITPPSSRNSVLLFIWRILPWENARAFVRLMLVAWTVFEALGVWWIIYPRKSRAVLSASSSRDFFARKSSPTLFTLYCNATLRFLADT